MPIPQSSTLPTTNKAPLLKRLYYQTRYCALICSALLFFKFKLLRMVSLSSLHQPYYDEPFIFICLYIALPRRMRGRWWQCLRQRYGS